MAIYTELVGQQVEIKTHISDADILILGTIWQVTPISETEAYQTVEFRGKNTLGSKMIFNTPITEEMYEDATCGLPQGDGKLSPKKAIKKIRKAFQEYCNDDTAYPAALELAGKLRMILEQTR